LWNGEKCFKAVNFSILKQKAFIYCRIHLVLTMGTYEPDADYRNMKPYKASPNLMDLLGGVTYDKAKELYRKNSQESGMHVYRDMKPLVFYTTLPVYGQMDPLSRAVTGYRGSPSKQPDMVAAKRALKQI
jgi:hypothetical protein